MTSHPIRVAWARFWPPPEAEKDPGFRKIILRQTKNGMAGLGIVGIVSVVLFISVRYFTADSFGWDYTAIPQGKVVLWDKIAILLLSIVCLALSRTTFGPPRGRFLVACLALAASTALLIDDLGAGDLSFSPAYLSLVMLGAVGTMPYRPMQILGLCVAIMAIYLCFLGWHSSTSGGGWLVMDPTRVRFLVIVTPICIVIAALIYSSRYELYKSRRRALKLKHEIDVKSKQLVRVEREKAAMLEESYQQLKALQAQLVHQAKMASLGRLTAGIAHEMKNPLNFVVNYASLSSDLTEGLLKRVSNHDRPSGDGFDDLSSIISDLQHNADKINKHGLRAAKIVDSMLQHSRTRSGEARHVDLNELVEESLHYAYHIQRAQHPDFNVAVEREYEDSIVTADLVPEEIGRVIINLLENAFYAVGERAAKEDDSFEPLVRVVTCLRDDCVEIRIRDNGPGLSEELRGKIFEPFFTTKPAGDGTGLGLFLSYEIVTQMHHGTIRVDSEIGRTEFIVSLPVATSHRGHYNDTGPSG